MRTVVRALVDPSLSVPGFLTCGAVLKRLHCIRRTLGASEARRSASNVREALDRAWPDPRRRQPGADNDGPDLAEWKAAIRLRVAVRRLAETDDPVKVVAHEAGSGSAGSRNNATAGSSACLAWIPRDVGSCSADTALRRIVTTRPNELADARSYLLTVTECPVIGAICPSFLLDLQPAARDNSFWAMRESDVVVSDVVSEMLERR